VVYFLKDVGKRSEECKQHGEVEADIQAKECNNRFGEEHVQRAEQGHCDEELYLCWAVGEWWWLGWETEFLGALCEDFFLIGFRGEEGECYGEDGEEDYSPLGPAPGFADGDEGADYGSWVGVSFESRTRRGGWEEKRRLTLMQDQGRD
jgi:hypothetical protein